MSCVLWRGASRAIPWACLTVRRPDRQVAAGFLSKVTNNCHLAQRLAHAPLGGQLALRELVLLSVPSSFRPCDRVLQT